ncbi:MAG: hypothetical protein Q9201_005517 [Fulgogasparrea decipioides]
MVSLSMTKAVVQAIHYVRDAEVDISDAIKDELGPALAHPAIGRPITHTQIVALSKLLKAGLSLNKSSQVSYHLDDLLRGSQIYHEPPKAKTEPTNEYKALMARLRFEEEARSYERLINPPQLMNTFEPRFPNSANSKLFADNQVQVDQDDDMTYADVNRQMALIINILVSIAACSIALWLVASRWNTASRLALSMGGSILVATAEAVVYAGYLRRVKEAREKGQKQIEIKEIIKTWVIGGDNKPNPQEKSAQMTSSEFAEGPTTTQGIRKRNVKPA